MNGFSELEKRVRAVLDTRRWRNRIGFVTGGSLIAFAMLALGTVLVSCKKQAPRYVSLAKLVAGGRVIGANSGAGQYLEYLQDFYGTIIETLNIPK